MFTTPSSEISSKLEAICPNCSVYEFPDSPTALQNWEMIPLPERMQMAAIYQQAFANAPWFEVGKCTNCGKFSPDMVTPCSDCGSTELGEAYPVSELLEQDFPQMIVNFVPGFLIIIKDDAEQVVGWTSCGVTQLVDLVALKYKGSDTALAGIMQLGLSSETQFLYLNEACVDPNRQQSGFGTALAQARMLYAAENNVPVVLSRTVNNPWLRVNQQIIAGLGYEVRQTILPGDETYVANSPRYTYIGVKS